MAENIKVDVRSDFGKGFARRMRAESKIPAVLYGHGTSRFRITRRLLPRVTRTLFSSLRSRTLKTSSRSSRTFSATRSRATFSTSTSSS